MSKKVAMREFPFNKIPAGGKHLYGNLFMLPFNCIKTPDMDEEESSEYRFRNPRLLTERGQADLLDKKLSSDLRDSIKNRTLLNPLVCRWSQEKDGLVPVIIGGDRRYRALDYLIRKKEEVVDPRSINSNDRGEWIYSRATADQAYEFVLCQVFAVNSDLEALALAWAENKSRINLTDGHEIAEVIKLREAEATDDRIVEILQQDHKWLAETDRLISSLDVNTLADLLEGRIDRLSAIQLAAISDESVRDRVRIAANEAAAETCQKRISRLQNRIEDALQRQEIAEGTLAVADSEELAEQAQQDIAEAQSEISVISRRRDEIAPVTTSRDVRRAAEEITGESAPRPRGRRGPSGPSRRISPNQYREGIEYLQNLIRNGGRCEDGTFTAHVDALRLLSRILTDNILENNADWAATLRSHYGVD